MHSFRKIQVTCTAASNCFHLLFENSGPLTKCSWLLSRHFYLTLPLRTQRKICVYDVFSLLILASNLLTCSNKLICGSRSQGYNLIHSILLKNNKAEHKVNEQKKNEAIFCCLLCDNEQKYTLLAGHVITPAKGVPGEL